MVFPHALHEVLLSILQKPNVLHVRVPRFKSIRGAQLLIGHLNCRRSSLDPCRFAIGIMMEKFAQNVASLLLAGSSFGPSLVGSKASRQNGLRLLLVGLGLSKQGSSNDLGRSGLADDSQGLLSKFFSKHLMI